MARRSIRHLQRHLAQAGALLLLALSCACTGAPSASDEHNTRVVTDDLGNQVTVVERPERIVSLAPNLTEIVFAVGAGDRLVADTSWCDYPPEATTKVRIGDTQRPDVERIVSLDPDLVLVSTASQIEGPAVQLRELGIPVYVSNPSGFAGVLASIERIGDLVGNSDEARRLSASLGERVDAVTRAVEGRPPVRLFFLLSDQPLMTVGGGTFVDDLIRRAGGVSISADETAEWPQYSLETVVARAPDAIVVPLVGHGVATDVMGVPEALEGTPAVRGGRVVSIDADLLMRPGPRLVDGLEALARELHPEAFR